jgi:PAS domain S-box-containing protein
MTGAMGLVLVLAGFLIDRAIRARTLAVTRAAATEADLRASEHRFQAIMDHAPLQISLKDVHGRFTFINRAFERRLGRTTASVQGMTTGDLFTKDYEKVHAALERKVVATKAAVQEEITAPGPTGPRSLLMVKFPLLDANGAVEAIGSMSVDITDQKRAEAQLAQAQKMESVGQLTGGVAHDFNNVLTVIMGTIGILADAIRDKPQLVAIARMIDEAAERGADLTRNLMAFARKQPLQPRPVDVNEVVAEVERLLRPTLGENIDIETAMAPDAWPALADPSQLNTALLNLALNARDAMPAGGKLTLETANVSLDEHYAQTHAEVAAGPYVMIAVSDTGAGIPANLVDRVFEPFFTTKGVGQGTGLGLSMVYGFVKQSNGHIKLYSEEGHGTSIKIYLPRAERQADEPAEAATEAMGVVGGRESVLLVEDDRLVRQYAIAQLTSLGYRVRAVEDAEAALALIDGGARFDLLLTDVILTGTMNGRQLADKVLRRQSSMKVLYTSGYSENAIIHHGRLDPGVLLLAKPYRRADLARMVRLAIEGDSTVEAAGTEEIVR